MQITLQTSFIKLPFFKSPFCIVVQLSFLYRLVIRIVLLCLSDSISLVAILFEVSLAVLGVALFSFLFILLYFLLFSAGCLICTPFLTRVPGLTVVASLSYPLYSTCSLDTWSSDCLLSFGSVFSCSFHFYHSFRSLYFSNKPTFIFLCKVSASGVLQGSPLGLPRDFFSSFWGAVAPDPKTPWSKMKKNNGHPLPLHTFSLPASLCT